MKQLDNKRQLDKEARRSYQERLAKSKTDAGKLKANYILSADDRAREDKARLASQQEARAYQDLKEKGRDIQRANELEAARVEREQRNAADDAFRKQTFDWKKQVDQSLINSRADRNEEIAAGDKKDFQNELAILEETVNGTGKGDSLKEMLDTGKISVDQVESIALRRLRFSTLPGPLRVKYAEAIDEILGPIFATHRVNTELAAGSPDAAMAGPPPPEQDLSQMRDYAAAHPGESLDPAKLLSGSMPDTERMLKEAQRQGWRQRSGR
jgi:hypothetical protein